jgi:hypothetical protein
MKHHLNTSMRQVKHLTKVVEQQNDELRNQQMVKIDFETMTPSDLRQMHVSNVITLSYLIRINIPLKLHFNWNKSIHMVINKQLQ